MKLIITSVVCLTIISTLFAISDWWNDKPNATSLQEVQHNSPDYEKIKNIQIDNIQAKKILLDCERDEYCLVEALQDLRRSENQQSVLETINDITSTYQKLGWECHDQGHHIGEYLYGNFGSLAEALSFADGRCGGAIYHGIMENYFKTKIFFENKIPDDFKITTICDLLGDNLTLQVHSECGHGIGHGLGIVYDNDVFNAVKRCDELDGELIQSACNTGAFMENVAQFVEKGEGNFDRNNILYPCVLVEEKYKGDCYQYQASYILRKVVYTTERGFDECDKIPSKKNIKDCYHGIGFTMSAIFGHKLDRLALECLKGDPALATYCIRGAAFQVPFQQGLDQGLKFCIIVPEEFKDSCYGGWSTFVHRISLDREDIENNCAMIEQEYYQMCMNAQTKERI